MSWSYSDYFSQATSATATHIDTFTCRLCGFTFDVQMYWVGPAPGSGIPLLGKRVSEPMVDQHLRDWHKDEILSERDQRGT